MVQLWVPLDQTGNSPLLLYKRQTAGITIAVPFLEALVQGAQKQHLLWLSQSKVRAKGSIAVVESSEIGFLWCGGGKIIKALRNRLLANAYFGFQEGQYCSIAFLFF